MFVKQPPITLLTVACDPSSPQQAAANESWTLVRLLTEGERQEVLTETAVVQNCGIPIQKSVECSAGTFKNLSVSLEAGVGVGQVGVEAGVANVLGFDRSSGESLQLETPPEGFIYRYEVSKEYRIITGQALARSSSGDEQEVVYTFGASCSIEVKSREKLTCENSGEQSAETKERPSKTEEVVQKQENIIPTARPTSNPTPTPVPIVSCSNEPQGEFHNLWAKYKDRLGCPQRITPLGGFYAEQPFQHGHMFWSKLGKLYLITIGDNTGTWRLFSEDESPWKDGMPPKSCEVQVPAGLFQPVRGFGGLWCAHADIREQLGWGLDDERGFEDGIDLIQGFEGGIIFRDSDGHTRGLAYVLFWDDMSFVRDSY